MKPRLALLPGIILGLALAPISDVAGQLGGPPSEPPLPPAAPPPPVPHAMGASLELQLLTRDTTEALGSVAAPGERVGRMFVVEKLYLFSHEGPIYKLGRR